MDVVGAIVNVTAAIFKIAKEVKANKEQCRQLVERIRTIEASLQTSLKATAVPENREDPKLVALLKLQNVLEDCHAEIHQYTDIKRFAVNVFRYLACRDTFAGLHNELDRCLHDLQVAFMTDLKDLLVEQKDRIAALQKDIAFLVKNPKLHVELYMKDAPNVSISPEQAEESFVKRLQKEQRSVTAISRNEGTSTMFEFSDSLIARSEVKIGEKIGKGGFGIVYAAEWNLTKVCAKQLYCSEDNLTPRAKASFKNEARMLSGVKHRNVVKLFGIVKDSAGYILVMEYFEKRCLRTVINRSFESLSWKTKSDYALQIALGMAYLHRQKFLHCDLKCSNILVRGDDSVAIADFGLAKVKQDTLNSLSELGHDSIRGNGGTIRWMAPELFEPGTKPSYATDVYAFAMILYELADGGYPFYGLPDDVIPLRVRQGERPDVPPDTPALIATIMAKSWTTKPPQRPRFDELVLALKTNNDAILELSIAMQASSFEKAGEDSGYQTQQPESTSVPPLNPVEAYWDALETGESGRLRTILSSESVEVDASKDGLTGLQFACRKNLSDIVKILLDFGADHQRKDKDGRLPIQLSTSIDVWRALASKMPESCGDLFDAAKKGDDVDARLILAAAANPFTKLNQRKEMDLDGRKIVTPLHAAAFKGRLSVCRVFLEMGVDIESRDNEKNTPLLVAAFYGHENVVKLLVDSGADIKSRDKDKYTPLMWAAWKGHSSIVQLLVERGAGINSKNDYGRTALHYASVGGNVETVNVLIEKDADIDSRSKDQYTPLMWAAWKGRANVVQFLIEKGADIHCSDEFGQTSLHKAAARGKENVVRLLLENGADIDIDSRDKDNNTPLMLAACKGHANVIQLLVKKGADPERRGEGGRTALHYAAAEGQLDSVRFLLDNGAEIESRDNEKSTPIILAAQYGNINALKLLVERGADIEGKGNFSRTPLHHAAMRGNVEVARYLLEQGADIESMDNEKKTTLMLAAGKGHVDVVQLLIERGANISGTDYHGQTPLHFASQWGKVDVVRLLLENGSEMECRDNEKSTPLIVAALCGNLSVLQVLLERGADIEGRGNYGRTPLHHAVSRGHVNVVRHLLKKGSDIESGDKQQKTPLILAACNGHANAVKLLVEEGAEIEAHDNCGQTALHNAAAHGKMDVVRLLLEKGANIENLDKNKDTPLLLAACNGHPNVVQLLVEKGANIEGRNEDGQTRLHKAAARGQVDVARLLLEMGADIETRDNTKNTPLILAAWEGHTNVVQLLVERGADIEGKDDLGQTPLHYAAQGGNVDISRLLIEQGADIESRDNENNTPLILAAWEGHVDMVRLLVDKGANLAAKGDDGMTARERALRLKRMAVAELLAVKDSQVSAFNSS
ncbi:hypothetical protein HDU96_010079 [Phlyctochytrium bullatum]|nr:hypothetical protein HDU96_010079 [Phlyctochytrium bullatum]